MKTRHYSHAWAAARICQSIWLESKQQTSIVGGRRLPCHAWIWRIVQPRRTCTAIPASTKRPCLDRCDLNIGTVKHERRCLLSWRLDNQKNRHFSQMTRDVSRLRSKRATYEEDPDAVLLAALEQSSASMAQSLINIMFHALRKLRNPSLAWESYLDLRERHMLQYLSRAQFTTLMQQFRQKSNHADGLKYVEQLVDDMQDMGYSVSKKEQMILLRLYGMNGRLSEMERIYQGLSRDAKVSEQEELQKAANNVLTAYQMHMNKIGTRTALEKSLDMYCTMIRSDIQPSKATSRLLMEVVRSDGSSAETCKLVWDWLWNDVGMSYGHVSLEPYLYKKLVLYFCSAGAADYALQVYDAMLHDGVKPGRTTMNALLHKVGRSGDIKKAMEIFEHMQTSPATKPDLVTFNALIDIYAHKRPNADTKGATEMYQLLQEAGFAPDITTIGILVDMFAKQGNIEMVRRLYRETIHTQKIMPNEHILSSLITCFIQNNDHEAALDLLAIMRKHKKAGEQVGLPVYNQLIQHFVRKRQIEDAMTLLDLMSQSQLSANARTFQPILNLLANDGDVSGARMVLDLMDRYGVKADPHTYASLMEAYAKSGDLEGTQRLFNFFKTRYRPNAYTFNILIYALIMHNEMEMVIDTYKRMLKTYIRMDEYTYSLLMYYFGQRKDPAAVEALLKTMESKDIKPNVTAFTTLMQSYYLCERSDDALKVLDRMKEAGVQPNFVTTSVLVNGSVQNGDIALAESIVSNVVRRAQNQTEECKLKVNDEYRNYDELADAKYPEDYHNRLPIVVQDYIENRRSQLSHPKIPPAHVFNPLLHAYTNTKEFNKAKRLLRQIHDLGVQINETIFVTIMKMYAEDNRIDIVEKMWQCLREQYSGTIDMTELDPIVVGISMPVQCPDVVQLLLQIRPELENEDIANRQRVVTSPWALSVYMDALSRAGKLDEIERVWEQLSNENYPFDEHNWNSRIRYLLQAGKDRQACQDAAEHLLGQSTQKSTRKMAYRIQENHPRLHLKTCNAFSKHYQWPQVYKSAEELRQAVILHIRKMTNTEASW